MRILVISDIHANLAAFDAVLTAAQGEWDTIWCLGDVIGYGPQPNECVERLREHDHLCLTGNHDWAVLGKLDISEFNQEAQVAVRWTQQILKEEARAYLDELPPKQVVDDYTLAHASPRHPVWEYILDHETAVENFAVLETTYCLVGHSHVPILFVQRSQEDAVVLQPTYRETLVLDEIPTILNPGSVGQPRDSDPRAAFALLDTEVRTWEFHRVAYPVHQTQALMEQCGLPRSLILRLEYGW